MKKKYFLGIVAMLMVIALALTGCGQQGEQNAGATGSESQGDNSSTGEVVTTEPESGENTGNSSQDKTPLKNADGKYIYTISVDGVPMEIATCVNVWDYITSDTPYDHVDLSRMLTDLGWEYLSGGYGTGTYTYTNDDCIKITPWVGKNEFNLPGGEKRVYGYTVAPWKTPSLGEWMFNIDCESISEVPYLVGKSDKYVSFEQIVAYAYLIDYYRYSTKPPFESDIKVP